METIRIVIQAEPSPLVEDLEKRIRCAIEGLGDPGARVRLSRMAESVRSTRGIPVRIGRRVRILDPGEILHAASVDDHCLVTTRESEYLVRASLSRLESMLDPSRWIRVHRRHLVRVDQVEGWRVLERGALVIRLREPAAEVPVSRSRRVAVRALWCGAKDFG